MFKFTRLENRILFDAAAAAVATDAAHQAAVSAGNADNSPTAPSSPDATIHHDTTSANTASAASSTQGTGEHILVISSHIYDPKTLADAALTNVKTIMYDSSTATLADIAAQITQALAGHKADSIAFITEGTPGSVNLLDSLQLTSLTIQTDLHVQQFIHDIGQLLNTGGTLDLLGCNVAQGSEGTTFMNVLNHALNEDSNHLVMAQASTNITGSSTFHGDWILESGSNTDVSSIYFNQQQLSHWDHALSAPTSGFNDLYLAPGSIFLNTPLTGGTFSIGTNTPITYLFTNVTSTSGTVQYSFQPDGTFILIPDHTQSGNDVITLNFGIMDSLGNTANGTIFVHMQTTLLGETRPPVPIAGEGLNVDMVSTAGTTTANVYSGVVSIYVIGGGTYSPGVAVGADAFFYYSDPQNVATYADYPGDIIQLGINGVPVTSQVTVSPVTNGIYVFNYDLGSTPGHVNFSFLDSFQSDNTGNFLVYIGPAVVGSENTVANIPTSHTFPGANTGYYGGTSADYTIVYDSNPGLFQTLPTLSANGVLTYTTAGVGSATIGFQNNIYSGTTLISTGITQYFTINSFTNVAPTVSFAANPLIRNEDQAQSIVNFATLGPGGGSGEANQIVTVTSVTNDNNALFSVQPTISNSGTLTYTPAADAFGTATVTVIIHDNGGTALGGEDTTTRTFTITINPVNDAPTFNLGNSLTVLEDASPQTVNGWASNMSAGPANESGQTLTFSLTNDNNALFSVQPTIDALGNLTYTLAPNAFGTANVTVHLQDSGGTANGGIDTTTKVFSIIVQPVNDVPSFTKGSDQTILEDAGSQTIHAWATNVSAGPANENSQAVNFIVTNDNNSLFSVQPTIDSNGNLTYTIAPNANGSAIVTVQLHDSGGTSNGGADTSATQTFVINVTPVNDAPSFIKGPDVTSLEDGGPQLLANWAKNISAGPSNEASQSVNFIVSNDNSSLFSIQPNIDVNGNLSYTAAADANGTATVTIRIHDDGGVSNGGVDTSAVQTFVIHITPVNDAPSFTKGNDISLNQTNIPQTINNWATDISSGPANESSQTISFIVTSSNPDLFLIQPTIDSSGNLNYVLAPNAFGKVTITVQAHDNGGTSNGGNDTSETQTFTLNVIPNRSPVPPPDNHIVIPVPIIEPNPNNPPPNSPNAIVNANVVHLQQANVLNSTSFGINLITLDTAAPESRKITEPLLPINNFIVDRISNFDLNNNSKSSVLTKSPEDVINDEIINSVLLHKSLQEDSSLDIPLGLTLILGLISPGARLESVVSPIRTAISTMGQQGKEVFGFIENEQFQVNRRLESVLVESPINAKHFELHADGKFVYSPIDGFNGKDSFVFQVLDSNGLVLSLAKVYVEVNPTDATVKTTRVVDKPKYAKEFDVKEDGTFVYATNLQFVGLDSFTLKDFQTDQTENIHAKVDVVISPIQNSLESINESKEEIVIQGLANKLNGRPFTYESQNLAARAIADTNQQYFIHRDTGFFTPKSTNAFWIFS